MIQLIYTRDAELFRDGTEGVVYVKVTPRENEEVIFPSKKEAKRYADYMGWEIE